MRLFLNRHDIALFQEKAYEDKQNTFVSSNTPLLSNLCMLENISLVLQVHKHLSRKKAYTKAEKALKLLNIENISLLRYEACSDKEIFLVQVIRASIQKEAKIIIEQPFMLLSSEIDLDFIFDALDTLCIPYERVLIIDLKHHENYYKESRCHIIK